MLPAPTQFSSETFPEVYFSPLVVITYVYVFMINDPTGV